jgi:hypothetical protein
MTLITLGNNDVEISLDNNLTETHNNNTAKKSLDNNPVDNPVEIPTIILENNHKNLGDNRKNAMK